MKVTAIFFLMASCAFAVDHPSADVVLSLAEQNRDLLKQYIIYWKHECDLVIPFEHPPDLPVEVGGHITEWNFMQASDGRRSKSSGKLKFGSDTGGTRTAEVNSVNDGEYRYTMGGGGKVGVQGPTIDDKRHEDWFAFCSWETFGGDLKNWVRGDAELISSQDSGLWKFKLANEGGFTCEEKYDLKQGGYLRSQIWTTPSGSIRSSREIELAQVADGFWFPKAIVDKAFQDGKLASVNTYTLDVRASKFNEDAEFADGFFDVEISPETTIIDHRGTEVVTYSGEKEPLPTDELEQLVSQSLPKRRGPGVLTWGVPIGLAVAAGAIFVWRRNQNA